jgi:isopentenyl-diphosphate delta-isomerase
MKQQDIKYGNEAPVLVVLVDEQDNPLGFCEKMEAHRKALLHRAVSVFIVNSKGEWLLQKRALDKYHSRGLWTNTCCTHPAPGESAEDSAKRRLEEEMGIKCELSRLFTFIYREKLDNELTEHEYDHVFIGYSDSDPVINTSEADDWRRMNFDELDRDIGENPDNYTYWFKQIYRDVYGHIGSIKNIRHG